ncbi:MAG: MIP/aquaporin family protein [Bacteroidota bacterium]
MSIYFGEFLGTMILIILGGGVVGGVLLAESKGFNSGWLVITTAWGLAVTMAIYAVGGISGAHINPAVTLGMAYIGQFPWSQVPGYIVAQILGAFTGAVIVWVHYLPHWRKTGDKATKLAVFSTAPAIRTTIANFISEMIATAVLILGLLFIGANSFTEGLNPLVVGGLIFVIGMALGGTTGYAINPARDLGPRIAHFLLPIAGKGKSDWGYAWIPVLAPLLGGVLGASLYQIFYKQDHQVQHYVVIGLAVVAVVIAVIRELKHSENE